MPTPRRSFISLKRNPGRYRANSVVAGVLAKVSDPACPPEFLESVIYAHVHTKGDVFGPRDLTDEEWELLYAACSNPAITKPTVRKVVKWIKEQAPFDKSDAGYEEAPWQPSAIACIEGLMANPGVALAILGDPAFSDAIVDTILEYGRDKCLMLRWRLSAQAIGSGRNEGREAMDSQEYVQSTFLRPIRARRGETEYLASDFCLQLFMCVGLARKLRQRLYFNTNMLKEVLPTIDPVLTPAGKRFMADFVAQNPYEALTR